MTHREWKFRSRHLAWTAVGAALVAMPAYAAQPLDAGKPATTQTTPSSSPSSTSQGGTRNAPHSTQAAPTRRSSGSTSTTTTLPGRSGVANVPGHAVPGHGVNRRIAARTSTTGTSTTQRRARARARRLSARTRHRSAAFGRSAGQGSGALRSGKRNGVTIPRVTPLSTLLARDTAGRGAGGLAPPAASGSHTAIGRVLDHIPDWSRPIIALLVVFGLVMWIRALLSGSRARKLARSHAELVVDLRVLQEALVPDVPAKIEPLATSVAYRPADGPATGGDFYDVFRMPGGQIGIVVGDASGHGRDAIARANSVRITLRAYLEIKLEPREALRTAGRVLSTDSPDGEFATALLAVFDPEDGTLTYSSGGHPPPIVVGRFEPEPVIACASPPIGWGLPTGQRQTTIPLPPDTTVCFFTDGLIEPRRGVEMLGRQTLDGLVRELHPDRGAEGILDRVSSLADAVTDDMAALIVRVEGDTEPVEVVIEQLEVDAIDLSRGRAELFLEACRLSAEEMLATLARAREIAHEVGGALLTVERRRDAAIVTVSARIRRGGQTATRA